ncbi:MAG: rhomboid family intramembrane serine protease [Candidatus Sumerlaeia bacterium]
MRETKLPNKTSESKYRDAFYMLFGFVALIWLIEVVDAIFFNGSLDRFGVNPRRLGGLWGIAFMPFLHGSFGHLASNTLPFIILGGMIMLQGKRYFVLASMVILLVSGSMVWLLGSSESVHIGASGLVFGYFGYLLGRAWFVRSPGAISLAVVVLFFYGGLIWGLRPFQDGVSWLGHLGGFFGGVASVWLMMGQGRGVKKTASFNLG